MSGSSSCAICQSTLGAGEEVRSCPGCGAVSHSDCWGWNQGCGVFGCSEAPPTVKLDDVEVPVSFWGREHKPCPRCGEEIMATAVRCRHCGARFESQRPEGSEEFRRRELAKARRPAVLKKIVWLFVLALIPLTAVVGGVMAAATLRREREALSQVPSLYVALLRLAAIVGLAQTALLVLVLVLYGRGA